MKDLADGNLDSSKNDERTWRDVNLNTYSVKSTYEKMREPRPEEEENVFTELWNLKALPIAVHFAWQMFLNKVPTIDNLVKRGVNVLSSQCIMCGNGEKSVEHLFF